MPTWSMAVKRWAAASIPLTELMAHIVVYAGAGAASVGVTFSTLADRPCAGG